MQAQCACGCPAGWPLLGAHCALGTIVLANTCNECFRIMAEEEESEESVTPKPAKKWKCLSLSEEEGAVSYFKVFHYGRR